MSIGAQNSTRPGSTEWVRSYLSHYESKNCEGVGLGSFNAHDIPDARDCQDNETKPLIYTVAFPLSRAKRQRCY